MPIRAYTRIEVRFCFLRAQDRGRRALLKNTSTPLCMRVGSLLGICVFVGTSSFEDAYVGLHSTQSLSRDWKQSKNISEIRQEICVEVLFRHKLGGEDAGTQPTQPHSNKCVAMQGCRTPPIGEGFKCVGP